MISALRAEKAEEGLLSALLQDYLAEMSAFYGLAPGEDGLFPYPYLPLYFTEPDRDAYFFRADDTLCGFALVNRVPFVDEPLDHALAEFMILPAFRGSGIAETCAGTLFALSPGAWQLKFSPANPRAAAFWRRIGRDLSARETALPDNEIAILFRI